jgi:hypothetical protein
MQILQTGIQMLARCSGICCLVAIVDAVESKCLSCHPEINECAPFRKNCELLLVNRSSYFLGSQWHFENYSPVATLNHSVLGTSRKSHISVSRRRVFKLIDWGSRLNYNLKISII